MQIITAEVHSGIAIKDVKDGFFDTYNNLASKKYFQIGLGIYEGYEQTMATVTEDDPVEIREATLGDYIEHVQNKLKIKDKCSEEDLKLFSLGCGIAIMNNATSERASESASLDAFVNGIMFGAEKGKQCAEQFVKATGKIPDDKTYLNAFTKGAIEVLVKDPERMFDHEDDFYDEFCEPFYACLSGGIEGESNV